MRGINGMVSFLKNCGLALIFSLCNLAFAEGNVATKYVSGQSTTIDFDEASIEGKMKAPSGFFLQGRKKQSLSQMVKLRSEFKNELREASSVVRALVK